MNSAIPMRTNKARILVVEDEAIIACDIEMQLQALGYEAVGHATRGEQAILMAGALRPDLVLMDIQLAGTMDGIAAAESIGTQYGLPVVFLTAYAADETLARAKLTDPCGYILKPFSERELHTVLELALYKHQTQARLRDSAERYRTLVEWSPESIAVLRGDTIIYANAAATGMLGASSAQELLGKPIFDVVHPDFHEKLLARVRSSADQAFVTAMVELVFLRLDGTPIDVEVRGTSIVYDGEPAVHVVARDVSLRKAQQTQLRLAAQVFAQGHEGILVTDAQARVVMVNQAFTTISGYRAAEVIGQNPRLLGSGRQDADFYRAMWEAIGTQGAWQGEIWNRRRDGTDYPAWLTISAVRDDQGAVCNFIGTFSDISEQRAARERINWLSHFDPLTGLPNRALLADRCTHDISTTQRDGRPLAMMVLGIDHFKLVNDTLGHAVGDQLLKQFARRIADALRDQDTVARVGGDEFVLVLPGDTPDGASLLALRLMQLLAQPYVVDGAELNITASVGIAICPPDGLEFEALFTSAEVAMHQAKRLGRGKHRFFNAEMLRRTLAQAELVAALRTAAALDQLHLHYQPFVDLQTGRISGMEALLRWTHPELGVVGPAQFIPIAEQTGLINGIGSWVLRQVCRDMRDWSDRGISMLPVSINISPVQFREAALVQLIGTTLREFSIQPGMLCIEVTEGSLIEDVPHSELLLRSLKNLGVGLSLDDFGTGYSSLSYLKRFPFDKVKIDQSFVRGIGTSSQDAVIAKVVISMAHGLGLQVIAEGVETEGQCAFLRDNACDGMQGYFFSRPVPKAELESLLVADRRLPARLRQAAEESVLAAVLQPG